MKNTTFSQEEFTLAGIWHRLLGAIIDLALFVIIFLIVLQMFGEFPEISETSSTNTILESWAPSTWARIAYYAAYFVVIACIAGRSQTPGKFFSKTYIVRKNGAPAGFLLTLLRELLIMAALFFFVPFVIASLWCIFDNKKQCLWDKVLGTYVVRTDNKNVFAQNYFPGLEKDKFEIETSPLHGRSQIADDLREIDLLLERGVINEKEHSERRHQRIHGES